MGLNGINEDNAIGVDLMYSGDLACGLARGGGGDYHRVGGVQGEVPVRQVFGRQRLFPFRVFPLLFDFQIAKHSDEHHKNDTAQATTDYQPQPPGQQRTSEPFVRVVGHVTLERLNLGAATALCVAACQQMP